MPNHNKIYLMCVIPLIALISFTLGRISISSSQTEKIVFENIKGNFNMPQNVFASSRGKNYYPWWCSAAQNLSKKYLVSYASEDKAKKAGLKKSKQC